MSYWPALRNWNTQVQLYNTEFFSTDLWADHFVGKPQSIKKGKKGYEKSVLEAALAKHIAVTNGDFLKTQTHYKAMINEIKTASELTDAELKKFSEIYEKYSAKVHSSTDEIKKSVGSVRDSAEKLSQGLARVEKAANFDRLERYVELLERAAVAMNMLAEIEKSGKLESIANALR